MTAVMLLMVVMGLMGLMVMMVSNRWRKVQPSEHWNEELTSLLVISVLISGTVAIMLMGLTV